MTGRVVTVGETMLLLSGRSVGAVPDLDTMHVDTGGAESNVAIGSSGPGCRRRGSAASAPTRRATASWRTSAAQAWTWWRSPIPTARPDS